jgi:hypothetical protein
MKSFVPFDAFGKTCAPKGKELSDTMQDNPESKFAPDPPRPCSDTPCPPYWQRTCNCRVNAEGLVDQEEVDGCGNTRWVRVAGKVIWTDTGNTECNDAINRFRKEQTNQCGDIRWINTSDYCCTPEWEDDSCGDGGGCYNCDFSMLRLRQIDGCGHSRLIDTGRPVTWSPTAERRCLDGIYEREEVNQCGDSRWVVVPGGGSLTWTDTGETRCTGTLIEKEQTNQCGDTQWVATSAAIVWTDTTTTSCAGDIYSVQQENQCGDTRNDARGAVTWLNTGELRCSDTDMAEKQQQNQCGDLRWIETGASCTVTLPEEDWGQEFGCHSRASNHNAAAGSRLRFNPDGTWAVTHGASYNTAHASGDWYTGSPPDTNLYECRIVGTKDSYLIEAGGIDCTGSTSSSVAFDTGWVTLSVPVDATVNAYAVGTVMCDQDSSQTLTFTATVREIANPANAKTGSGSICADASAIAG